MSVNTCKQQRYSYISQKTLQRCCRCLLSETYIVYIDSGLSDGLASDSALVS